MGDQAPEPLTIQLADPDPGPVELRVTIQDLISGSRLRRSARFTVPAPDPGENR